MKMSGFSNRAGGGGGWEAGIVNRDRDALITIVFLFRAFFLKQGKFSNFSKLLFFVFSAVFLTLSSGFSFISNQSWQFTFYTQTVKVINQPTRSRTWEKKRVENIYGQTKSMPNGARINNLTIIKYNAMKCADFKKKKKKHLVHAQTERHRTATGFNLHHIGNNIGLVLQTISDSCSDSLQRNVVRAATDANLHQIGNSIGIVNGPCIDIESEAPPKLDEIIIDNFDVRSHHVDSDKER